MALKYTYTLLRTTPMGKVEVLNATTQKWSLQKYITKEFIEAGYSIDWLSIVRCKDGMPNTLTYVDPYEFMHIDLGEA